ncbi:MAG: dTDP-4-dehydrorhamnose reductase [Solirubrobacteraceae bacterium]|nr:dTDP-4-dehydrorhamnose reductase [Solirubrobacteraceae bacterium]
MRLVVTGAGGMLGGAVCAAARAAGHEVLALDRAALDVTDAAACRERLVAARPDAVVNCAAWTDVDGAEIEEAQATAVNGAGAGNVAAGAAVARARIVHVSTDYVFPGDGRDPYVESDAVGPRTAYGRSKLAGEIAVAAAGADHAIARTAWLFGAGGANFVDTMLRLGAERDELRVVDDQIGCPTWTGHLAPALVALAAGRARGVFHAAGGGRATWFELAREALSLAGSHRRVEPTTTAEFPRPAARPAFSVLASERGADAVRLPDWREGLRGHLADIRSPTPGGTP